LAIKALGILRLISIVL